MVSGEWFTRKGLEDEKIRCFDITIRRLPNDPLRNTCLLLHVMRTHYLCWRPELIKDRQAFLTT